MVQYKINQIFETIQGEGRYTGTPAIFVRLQGCPVGCSWCDTKHTWQVSLEQQVSLTEVVNKTGDTETWSQLTATELVTLIKQQGYRAKHVVITGGEPCIYDLTEMTSILRQQGFSSQIETSGTFDIRCDDSTWVTVSPKLNMKGGYQILAQALDRANEIKHPVAMMKHVDELKALLTHYKADNMPLVYLQPISQQRRATELAVSECINNNWCLSLQTHKYIGIE